MKNATAVKEVFADVACHSRQGDTHTDCGKLRQLARYVEQWDFVSCSECLRARGKISPWDGKRK